MLYKARVLIVASSEREQSQGDQFEMLLGEGQSNNGDRQDQPVYKMGDSNLPTKEHDPDHIEDHIANAVGVFHIPYFPSKGSKSRQADLDGLDPEGDANDGYAETNPSQDVAHAGQKAAKDQPDDISQY
jgi:hypothetical protein